MTSTPLTDALLAERRHQDATDWNAGDVMAFLRHARKLESELEQLRQENEQLRAANEKVLATAAYHEHIGTDLAQLKLRNAELEALVVKLQRLLKEMDDDLKNNMPEYECLEGVTEALSTTPSDALKPWIEFVKDAAYTSKTRSDCIYAKAKQLLAEHGIEV